MTTNGDLPYFTPEDTHADSDEKYRAPDDAKPGHHVEPLVLPPNTELAHFQKYLSRAVDVVGIDNVTVISSEAELSLYDYMKPSKASDMFYLLNNDTFLCSAVVAPKDVPDVQALVKLANEFVIPIWTFSVGRNLGYGGAAVGQIS